MNEQAPIAPAGGHDPAEEEYKARFNVPSGESVWHRRPRRMPPDEPGPSWDDAVKILEERW